MLEYNIDEAEKMLGKNLESANKTLETVENDLGFLKDQYVTTEVSILFQNKMIALTIGQLCHQSLHGLMAILLSNMISNCLYVLPLSLLSISSTQQTDMARVYNWDVKRRQALKAAS
jgi:hypothetical protein